MGALVGALVGGELSLLVPAMCVSLLCGSGVL